MRKFMRYLTLVFIVLVFFAGLVFALSNTTRVGLSFALWQLPPLPVSVWIVLAFSLGGVIGLLVGVGMVRNLRARAEIRQLRKRLQNAEQEVTRLRAVSLRDISRDLPRDSG